MAGDEAEGLDPLLERAHGRIGHARRVGRVLDQYLAATGLQHGGVVGAHADVACQPRLLVEIDGAEGEQRMAVRGDGDQLLRRQRVGIAGVVEIGQRQRRVQIGDHRRQLRRRRIAALAADVEMHVVPEQRDIGGDHDGDRRGSDERGGQPRGKARAGAAQRQPQRQHEQREQRQRPGREQQAVGGVVRKAGKAERAERDGADHQNRDDNIGSSGLGHTRLFLSAAPARARSATASTMRRSRRNRHPTDRSSRRRTA